MNESYENQFKILQPSRSLSPSIMPIERGNFILRQELHSYTPECNAKCGIIFNTCLIFIFLAIGLSSSFYIHDVREIVIPYTDCSRRVIDLNNNTDSVCKLTFTVNETIIAPVFFYYELDNFLLNHRDLVKSKIWSQLRGETHIDSTNNFKCEGATYMYEMFDNDTSKYKTYWGKPLKADDFANPCGLVAKSLFNDTYQLEDSKGKDIIINEKGIANLYEKNNYFKRWKNYTDVQWMDVENEHFINWMSMETYSSFRKLWGRIERDLRPDNYTIIVHENYNTSKFNAKKSIVLSTATPFGTASFFGILLIIGANYCLCTIFVLWVLHVSNGYKKFDYSVLKWK